MEVTRRYFITTSASTFFADWTGLASAVDAPQPFGAGAHVPSGRIQRLLARALAHDIKPNAIAVVYDPADAVLPEPVRIGKRLKENQGTDPSEK